MIAGNGLSPIAPPWTLLTAYDLNEGIIKWKIPLGKFPELLGQLKFLVHRHLGGKPQLIEYK